MSLFGSKKGVLQEAVAGIIFLFVASVSFPILMLVLLEFNDAVTGAGFADATIAAEQTKWVTVLGFFDYIPVIIMVVLILGIGILSRRVASGPVFFLIAILGSAMLGFVSYFFNHLYIQIVSQSVFTASILYFPRTIMIATNLHWVALAIFAVGSITLYGKREKGQFVG